MCVCVSVRVCKREREVLKGLDLHVSFYPQLLLKVELKQMAARVSGSILGRLAFFDGKKFVRVMGSNPAMTIQLEEC